MKEEIKTLATIAQEFEEKFEFHDLGKPHFTLCENISKEGCNGGVSISEEEEEIAKKMLENIKSFWLSHIRTMIEEMKKGVERKKRNTPHTQVQKDLAGHHIGYNQALSDVLSILNKYCS